MAGPVPGAQDNPASPGGIHGLDTNVVVSAVATRGLCSDVLRSVIESHSLVLSETVFRELRRVLLRKFGVPRGTVEAVETFLREEGEIIREAAALGIALDDPDDVPILEEAVAGMADLLVTGDEDLLRAAEIAPVEIVSPRGFWHAIKS